MPCPEARRVGAMRRIARAYLAHHGMAGMEFPVTLIVSELVTNAIVHGQGTEVGFTMAFRADHLYIAARSDGPGIRAPDHAPAVDDEHGRGLQLVAFMVSELGGMWGIEDDGTTVSCHLPVVVQGR
ncbi:ATP-binding protein [Streptomyces sp. NPDC079020]|uniref:ATP-binding protein n=1 Tax=Streptomyces sp. NPDC079020 TaxID=3365722 RepID=UPI0037D363A1